METIKNWFLRIRGVAKDIRGDESGATMIEYSILIGLVTALIIGAIVSVGTWVQTQWTTLCTAMGIAC